MENSAAPVISLKDVSIGYGSRILISHVNLDIEASDIIAILGLNGTGKSTLLRTIGKLQSPLDGKIYLHGRDLHTISEKEFASQAALVLTGRGDMIPSLTVSEIFSIARSPYTGVMHTLSAVDIAVIENVMHDLHIEHLASKKLYQLSDGEAQKIFIAKALIQEVPLILMDEPTAHLDILNTLEIFSLIKDLSARNKTIIFASHALDLSLQIATKCFLLDHAGNFIFGKTVELIEKDAFRPFFSSDKYGFNAKENRFEAKTGG